jgi:hypothetical protein
MPKQEATARRQIPVISYHAIHTKYPDDGGRMNRWQRLWLSVKLITAVAACVAAGVQAFFYMMDSTDASRIHPLSILVAGLIFGFITFGLLSFIEEGIRRLLAPLFTAKPQPQANADTDSELVAQPPLILSTDDSAQQKSL